MENQIRGKGKLSAFKHAIKYAGQHNPKIILPTAG